MIRRMNDAQGKLAAALDVSSLPSIPHVLLQFLEACNSTEVSFERLTAIVERDAGLSSKVIAAANTPVYAQWTELKEFNRVLVVLGLNTVKTIAITSAAQQFFSRFAQGGDGFLDGFWYRSLMCAHVARELARLTAYDSLDEAYLAGLLHRIGQLALRQIFPREHLQLLAEGGSGATLELRERERFGAGHAELGGMLIDSWQLQSFLADAVRFQHESVVAVMDAPPLVKAVYLASHLSTDQEGERAAAFAQADQLFGLSQSLVEDLLEEVQGNVCRAAEGMGIPIPPLGAPGQGDAAAPEVDPLQLELAERVRDFALVNGAVQQLGKLDSLDAVLAAIHQDLGILFGLSRSLFFVYIPEQDRLQGVHAGGASLVDELSIPLTEGRSLVAMALRQRRPVHSFEAGLTERLTVVDRQVARMLEHDGILCLPLLADGLTVGTLVAGIDRARLEHHSRQLSLLVLFGAEAAGAIARQQAMVETERRIIDNERSLYETRTRMLVHEASNPLAIVNNYLHVLGMKLGDEHPVHEELGILKEEIERVGHILLRMRDLSREDEQEPGVVDVNALIRDLLRCFAHPCSRPITSRRAWTWMSTWRRS
jgi:HD-like signal output (HDOD) protein